MRGRCCPGHAGYVTLVRSCAISPEVVAHDRARRYAASHRFEAGAREGRGIARARSARRQPGIERIGFERRSLGAPGGLHGRGSQRRRHAPPTIALAHVEAGERPDRDRVLGFESPRAIEPWQGRARRELTPAHGRVAVEGEQARWRTALHDLAKRRLVVRARSRAIGAADPPVHAPAAVAGPVRAEQVLERRPQIRRQRPDRKLQL